MIDNNASPVIALDGVTKSFGDFTAVEDLSFEVHPGQIFGFIGPSGSGKTTTIRLMTGVHQPTSGSVHVLGKHAHQMDARTRARMGYLPQLFILYPHLSVKENLDFAASLYGESWLGRRDRRTQLLKFVELWDHRHKLARDISGGMQRRLELACALIHNPALVFLDEPTAGIDPILRAKFWQSFHELKAEGRTLFVTTQYVTEAEYCDLVAVVDEGRMVAMDSPENLRRRAFGGDLLEVRSTSVGEQDRATLARISGVRAIDTSIPGRLRLAVESAATATPAVMEALRGKGHEVEGIELYKPTFDEVFVRLLQKEATRG
jgi:ABC-2 type transport system ATP-binding protein